jgi:glycosyltransferase involved in cell wall biosynthesis
MPDHHPLVTVVVPSLNQGCFLDETLKSIFNQTIPLEVFLMDGGSTDNSIQVIQKWENKLAGWRSSPDEGQAASINEGIKCGSAPFVCWVNSDDMLLPDGLRLLTQALLENPGNPAAYGMAWNYFENSGNKKSVWVEKFDRERLAIRCIISQPATLIRRSAWDKVGGLDEKLHTAMDFDLWWKLSNHVGDLLFIDDYIAINRIHHNTKTNLLRKRHYMEAKQVVKKYYNRLPLKWWVLYPYAVWFKSILNAMKGNL